MATIRKEFVVEASPALVWIKVREFGKAHDLAPGFVVDTLVDGTARVVKFKNGFAVRELLVTLDDAGRRICYAAVSGAATHHNASMQVFDAEAGRTLFVWIADFLPDDVGGVIDSLMEEGQRAIQRAFTQHGSR